MVDSTKLTCAELLAHNVWDCDSAVDNRLGFEDVFVVAVPSRPFIGDTPGTGATSPLIGVNLLKHSCLVKKGQVPLKVKICVWDLLNVISKALVIFSLHLAIF